MDNIKEILKLHKKWIKNEADGIRADLRGADLRKADLRRADLSEADLSGADLREADLSEADLSRADLSGAYLSRADLRGADLRGADLSEADLRRADLRGAKHNENTAFLALQCPEEGSFIGYKICRDSKIVKLLITEDAKRSSATTRKCRASKVKVLEITNIENTKKYKTAISKHDESCAYKVGETIEVTDFDDNRWEECSTGIHFFITRDEAVQYD